MYHAISNKDTDLLKTGKNGKKTFRLLVLCIKIKFTIACSLISLIKKICIELWVNKCTTSLFWNIRTCLIHVNTSTPSLVVFGYSWNTWWRKLSTDASFRLKMLSSLFADEKNFPTVARIWIRLKRLGRLELKTWDFTILYF